MLAFTVLRLVVPLLILKRPLVGAIVAALLDSWDWSFVPHSTEQEYAIYQIWDKLLDTYYLTLEAYMLLGWGNALLRRTGLFLYFARFLGVVGFIAAGLKGYLFLFPNIFEFFFVFCLLYEYLARKDFVPNRAQLSAVLAAISIPKFIQEYAFHINPVFPWDSAGIFSPSAGVVHNIVDKGLWIAVYLALPVYILTRFIQKKA